MKTRRILAALATLSLFGCIDVTIGSSSPKLLVCPSSTALTGSFLADPLLGGNLTLGGTTVSIPAGAVSAPQLFIVTIPASKYMEVDVTADGLTSFLFNQPATISIDYSRCSTSATENRNLQVWHVAPLTHTLLENMNATDNSAARKITFQTGHLSTYGVAY